MNHLTTIIIIVTQLSMYCKGTELFLPSGVKDTPCRFGVYYPEEDKCMWYNIDEKWINPQEQQTRCRENGNGDLVSITTEAKQRFIQEVVLKDVGVRDVAAWIGLWVNADREVVWANGQAPTYRNFEDEDDAGLRTADNCGKMDGSFDWIMIMCTAALESGGGICEAPVCMSDKCEHGCDNQSSPVCQCYPGFNLVNGTDCKEIDLCAKNDGGCEHGMCETENGTTKVCSCRDGFKAVGDRCEEDSAGKKGGSGNTFLIVGLILAAIVGIACVGYVLNNKSKANTGAAAKPRTDDEVEPKKSASGDDEEEGADGTGKKMSEFSEDALHKMAEVDGGDEMGDLGDDGDEVV